jgi:hypothetical protein
VECSVGVKFAILNETFYVQGIGIGIRTIGMPLSALTDPSFKEYSVFGVQKEVYPVVFYV